MGSHARAYLQYKKIPQSPHPQIIPSLGRIPSIWQYGSSITRAIPGRKRRSLDEMRQCLAKRIWPSYAVLGEYRYTRTKTRAGAKAREESIRHHGDRLDLATAARRQAKVIRLMTMISFVTMNGFIDIVVQRFFFQ